jgi:uncharacterized protein
MGATISIPGFEWDNDKAVANLKKHDISFEEASTTFLDENAVYFSDAKYSDRLVVLGFSRRANMLYVVFAERRGGAILRLISAREATPSERKRYHHESP